MHSRNTSSCKSANQHLNERRYHLELNFKPSQLTSFFSGKIPSYILRFSQNNRARPSKISRTMHVLELSIHDLILRMQRLQGLTHLLAYSMRSTRPVAAEDDLTLFLGSSRCEAPPPTGLPQATAGTEDPPSGPESQAHYRICKSAGSVSIYIAGRSG